MMKPNRQSDPAPKGAPRWKRVVKYVCGSVGSAIIGGLVGAFGLDPAITWWRDWRAVPAFERFETSKTSCRDLDLIISKAEEQRPDLKLAPPGLWGDRWRAWFTKQTRMCADLILTAEDAPTALDALQAIAERVDCFGYSPTPSMQPSFYVNLESPQVCIAPFELDKRTNTFQKALPYGDPSQRILLCLGGELGQLQERERVADRTPAPCAEAVLERIPDFRLLI